MPARIPLFKRSELFDASLSASVHAAPSNSPLLLSAEALLSPLNVTSLYE